MKSKDVKDYIKGISDKHIKVLHVHHWDEHEASVLILDRGFMFRYDVSDNFPDYEGQMITTACNTYDPRELWIRDMLDGDIHDVIQ